MSRRSRRAASRRIQEELGSSLSSSIKKQADEEDGGGSGGGEKVVVPKQSETNTGTAQSAVGTRRSARTRKPTSRSLSSSSSQQAVSSTRIKQKKKPSTSSSLKNDGKSKNGDDDSKSGSRKDSDHGSDKEEDSDDSDDDDRDDASNAEKKASKLLSSDASDSGSDSDDDEDDFDSDDEDSLPLNELKRKVGRFASQAGKPNKKYNDKSNPSERGNKDEDPPQDKRLPSEENTDFKNDNDQQVAKGNDEGNKEGSSSPSRIEPGDDTEKESSSNDTNNVPSEMQIDNSKKYQEEKEKADDDEHNNNNSEDSRYSPDPKLSSADGDNKGDSNPASAKDAEPGNGQCKQKEEVKSSSDTEYASGKDADDAANTEGPNNDNNDDSNDDTVAENTETKSKTNDVKTDSPGPPIDNSPALDTTKVVDDAQNVNEAITDAITSGDGKAAAMEDCSKKADTENDDSDESNVVDTKEVAIDTKDDNDGDKKVDTVEAISTNNDTEQNPAVSDAENVNPRNGSGNISNTIDTGENDNTQANAETSNKKEADESHSTNDVNAGSRDDVATNDISNNISKADDTQQPALDNENMVTDATDKEGLEEQTRIEQISRTLISATTNDTEHVDEKVGDEKVDADADAAAAAPAPAAANIAATNKADNLTNMETEMEGSQLSKNNIEQNEVTSTGHSEIINQNSEAGHEAGHDADPAVTTKDKQKDLESTTAEEVEIPPDFKNTTEQDTKEKPHDSEDLKDTEPSNIGGQSDTISTTVEQTRESHGEYIEQTSQSDNVVNEPKNSGDSEQPQPVQGEQKRPSEVTDPGLAQSGKAGESVDACISDPSNEPKKVSEECVEQAESPTISKEISTKEHGSSRDDCFNNNTVKMTMTNLDQSEGEIVKNQSNQQEADQADEAPPTEPQQATDIVIERKETNISFSRGDEMTKHDEHEVQTQAIVEREPQQQEVIKVDQTSTEVVQTTDMDVDKEKAAKLAKGDEGFAEHDERKDEAQKTEEKQQEITQISQKSTETIQTEVMIVKQEELDNLVKDDKSIVKHDGPIDPIKDRADKPSSSHIHNTQEGAENGTEDGAGDGVKLNTNNTIDTEDPATDTDGNKQIVLQCSMDVKKEEFENHENDAKLQKAETNEPTNVVSSKEYPSTKAQANGNEDTPLQVVGLDTRQSDSASLQPNKDNKDGNNETNNKTNNDDDTLERLQDKDQHDPVETKEGGGGGTKLIEKPEMTTVENGNNLKIETKEQNQGASNDGSHPLDASGEPKPDQSVFPKDETAMSMARKAPDSKLEANEQEVNVQRGTVQKVTEQESMKQEATKLDSTNSEATKEDATKSESIKPESTEKGVTEPVTLPESSISEGGTKKEGGIQEGGMQESTRETIECGSNLNKDDEKEQNDNISNDENAILHVTEKQELIQSTTSKDKGAISLTRNTIDDESKQEAAKEIVTPKLKDTGTEIPNSFVQPGSSPEELTCSVPQMKKIEVTAKDRPSIEIPTAMGNTSSSTTINAAKDFSNTTQTSSPGSVVPAKPKELLSKPSSSIEETTEPKTEGSDIADNKSNTYESSTKDDSVSQINSKIINPKSCDDDASSEITSAINTVSAPIDLKQKSHLASIVEGSKEARDDPDNPNCGDGAAKAPNKEQATTNLKRKRDGSDDFSEDRVPPNLSKAGDGGASNKDPPLPGQSDNSSAPKGIVYRGYSRFKLNQIKTLIYVAGSRVHRGCGFEKIFADYWNALALHVAGRLSPRASDICQNAFKAFLKTRKLRRLHNKLILGILKRVALDEAPLAEVGEHIPDTFWDRIDIVEAGSSPDLAARKVSKEPTPPSLPDSAQSIAEKQVFRAVWCPTEPTIIPSSENKKRKATAKEPSSNDADNADSLSSIPGALSIDPIVRDIAKGGGMKVTENAIWLLVVATKEYVKNTLKDLVNVKESVAKGQLPPRSNGNRSILPSSGKKPSTQSDNKKHKQKSDSSKDDHHQDKKRKITSMDVHSYTACKSLGSIGSLGNAESLASYELGLHSLYDSNPTVPQHDFLNVHRFLTSQITETASQRKVEAEHLKLEALKAPKTPPRSGQSKTFPNAAETRSSHASTAVNFSPTPLGQPAPAVVPSKSKNVPSTPVPVSSHGPGPAPFVAPATTASASASAAVAPAPAPAPAATALGQTPSTSPPVTSSLPPSHPMPPQRQKMSRLPLPSQILKPSQPPQPPQPSQKSQPPQPSQPLQPSQPPQPSQPASLGASNVVSDKQTAPQAKSGQPTAPPKQDDSGSSEPTPPPQQGDLSALRSAIRGLGRGAKNLAALKARTSSSTPTPSGIPENEETPPPTTGKESDEMDQSTPGPPPIEEPSQNKTNPPLPENDSQPKGAQAAEKVDSSESATQPTDQPSKTEDSNSAPNGSTESNAETNNEASQEQSESQKLAMIAGRRGKGFGIKNLAAMRARSLVKSDDSPAGDDNDNSTEQESKKDEEEGDKDNE